MGLKRRREFEEALRNVTAELVRSGEGRIERFRVEELGGEYDLDPEKARELFLDSRGDVWRGDLIESDDEAGWEAATLEYIPSAGIRPEEGI